MGGEAWGSASGRGLFCWGTLGTNCDWCFSGRLDGKHVVFGRVKEGMNVVEAMERCGSKDGKTSKKITITDCGQLS